MYRVGLKDGELGIPPLQPRPDDVARRTAATFLDAAFRRVSNDQSPSVFRLTAPGRKSLRRSRERDRDAGARNHDRR